MSAGMCGVCYVFIPPPDQLSDTSYRHISTTINVSGGTGKSCGEKRKEEALIWVLQNCLKFRRYQIETRSGES